jgi:osmotically-inducible protein OsmY
MLLAGLAALVAVAVPLGAAETITDQSVTDAVEDELLFDQAVPANKINLTTAEGVVTLRGAVNNALAKQRAARLAETVKGVRSVVNRITVEPPAGLDDATLKRDVVEALAYDPATESYELDVSVTDGVVTLSGTTQSWQEKSLAEQTAMSVRGVTDVRNNISVNYSADRPDMEIRPEIEEALRWDTMVDDGLIDVEVDDGKVTLTGTVGSAAEKRRARYTAWVPGVTAIDTSPLNVERWARDEDLRKTKYVNKSSEAMRNAVADALLYDPRVLATNVTVDMTGSVATLRGEVRNAKAKRAAEQVAKRTVGVSSVVNRLKVRPEAERADEEIADSVRRALARDAYVDRYEIAVSVVDGTAYLYGTVDTWFEKGRADTVAATAKGVEGVRNNLEVDREAAALSYDPYVDDYDIYTYEWYDYEPVVTFEDDAEIREEIKDEVWWSPFIDSDNVSVAVDNGVATLTGTVDTWSQRGAALENAYEGGATWVINDLDVE